MSSETDVIVPCADLKCVKQLLSNGKMHSLNLTQKKYIISSPKPTPDLCISKTSKSHRRNFNRSVYKTRWICGCSDLNKLFCWFCIFFSNDKNVWNSSGYDDLSNLVTGIKRHQNTQKHLNAVISFHNFGKQRIELETSLSRQLSEDIINYNLKVDHNRSVFQRLVDVVCVSSQQELSYDETKTSSNGDNFLELISLLSKYDLVLERHMQQSNKPGSSNYLCNEIQNNIIHSVSEVMKTRIQSEIKMTTFVSIIIDETPDVSNGEQLCLILRYFSGNNIHDRFLGFIDVSENRTADAITKILLDLINDYDCEMKLVAQSYDGASVMSGLRNGVQQKVKEFCPQAIYIWCNAHILNLVLSKSCSRIGEVSSFFSALQALINFFSNSTKRTAYYDKFCTKELPHISATCSSRIVNTIFELKNNLVNLFTEIVDNPQEWDGDTNLSAENFCNSLKSFDFIFFLELFHTIFEKTDSLYNIIQKSQVEVGHCSNKIKEFHTWLRTDLHSSFDRIYNNALQNNSAPRLRRNISCAHTEYKRIFLQIIDNIASEINDRYSEIFKLQFFQLFNNKLYDEYKLNFPIDDFASLEKYYGSYFEKEVLKNQLIGLYSSPELKDYNVFQLIDFINENSLEDAFSELLNLAYLVVTIPATTASAERSFSALKRIHTYLRNTQGQDRLSEHSLIAIEKQLLQDLKRSSTFYDDVMKSFLKKDSQFELQYK